MSVTVSAEHDRALRAQAKRFGISVSEVLRRMIDGVQMIEVDYDGTTDEQIPAQVRVLR